MGTDVHKENWHVTVLLPGKSRSMAGFLGSVRRGATLANGLSSVRSGPAVFQVSRTTPHRPGKATFGGLSQYALDMFVRFP